MADHNYSYFASTAARTTFAARASHFVPLATEDISSRSVGEDGSRSNHGASQVGRVLAGRSSAAAPLAPAARGSCSADIWLAGFPGGEGTCFQVLTY